MRRIAARRTDSSIVRHVWGVGAQRVRAVVVTGVVVVMGGCAPHRAPPVAPVPASDPERPPARTVPASDADAPPALMVPVSGVAPERVPDTFSARRGDRAHRAVDILAPRGTPVVAAADGRIYRIRDSAAGGLSIYATDISARWMFYYAHLDSVRPDLGEGTKLAQGEVIGYVGTTGNAPPDTPHLHFQLMRARFDARWWDGEALDPRPYFVTAGEQR